MLYYTCLAFKCKRIIAKLPLKALKNDNFSYTYTRNCYGRLSRVRDSRSIRSG